MSHYLIDSHILIWWLSNAANLNTNIKQIIENQDNTIWVSVATIWEIGIKQNLGKLNISEDLLVAINNEDFKILRINENHANYATKLPLHHKDPFDRMLIAQATIENIPIISQDEIFHQYLPFPFLKNLST